MKTKKSFFRTIFPILVLTILLAGVLWFLNNSARFKADTAVAYTTGCESITGPIYPSVCQGSNINAKITGKITQSEVSATDPGTPGVVDITANILTVDGSIDVSGLGGAGGTSISNTGEGAGGGIFANINGGGTEGSVVASGGGGSSFASGGGAANAFLLASVSGLACPSFPDSSFYLQTGYWPSGGNGGGLVDISVKTIDGSGSVLANGKKGSGLLSVIPPQSFVCGNTSGGPVMGPGNSVDLVSLGGGGAGGKIDISYDTNNLTNEPLALGGPAYKKTSSVSSVDYYSNPGIDGEVKLTGPDEPSYLTASVSLLSDKLNYTVGEDVVLTWTSQNVLADSCDQSGDWSDQNQPSSKPSPGVIFTPGAGSYTYTLTCDRSGTARPLRPYRSVTITVSNASPTSNAPTPTISSGAITLDSIQVLAGISSTGGENADLMRISSYGSSDSTCSGIPANNDSASGSFGVYSNNYDVTKSGLDPAKTYYFKAGAHNSIGWGYTSCTPFTTSILSAPDVTFTAIQVELPRSTASSNAGGTGSISIAVNNHVDLNWSTTGDTCYGNSYEPDGTTVSNWTGVDIKAIPTGSDPNILISQANLTYFWLYCYNGAIPASRAQLIINAVAPITYELYEVTSRVSWPEGLVEKSVELKKYFFTQ